MNWTLILLFAAIVVFALTAWPGIEIKKVNPIALGLALFAASFWPF